MDAGTGKGIGESAAAELELAAAERTRIDGMADPQAWSVPAIAFATLGLRPLEAYARYRLGEALLARNGPRDEVTTELRAASRLAVS